MNGPTPRIVKETNNLKTEHVAGIKCEVDPNNFRHFFVKIDGKAIATQALRKPVTKEASSTLNCCCLRTTR